MVTHIPTLYFHILPSNHLGIQFAGVMLTLLINAINNASDKLLGLVNVDRRVHERNQSACKELIFKLSHVPFSKEPARDLSIASFGVTP